MIKLIIILKILLFCHFVWADRKDKVNLFELYNACRNIDGADFSKIARPQTDSDELDLIQPRDTIRCVQELVKKELIFSHEINNTFTVSLDFDRRVKEGDLNDFTANIQNIRKILTNRFGDTMTLYDFNRIQAVDYQFHGNASLSFRGNCEGWLSYSAGGFSELKFLKHLDEHALAPSLEKLFIDFNRDIAKESVLKDYFGLETNPVIRYGSSFTSATNMSKVYGRSIDNSFTCRYFYEDLIKFALGEYVQKSDMRKIDVSDSNYQKLDNLIFGVNNSNEIKNIEYVISDEMDEYEGFPRVLITNPRDFVFKSGISLLESIGIKSEELIFGRNFFDLVKNRIDLLQDKLNKIKAQCGISGISNQEHINDFNQTIGEANLGLVLQQLGSCVKKNVTFDLVDFDIGDILSSPRIDSASLLSPSFIFSVDENGNREYLQALYVTGHSAFGDISGFVPDSNYFSCPSECIGDLPCLKKSINERVYACVPSDVDFVTGCQKFEQETEVENDLFRCLAFRNVTQSFSETIVTPFDFFHFIDDLESIGEIFDKKLSELNTEIPSNKEIRDTFFYHSSHFFAEYFSHLEETFVRDDYIHPASPDEKETTFNTYRNNNQLSCSENNNFDVTGAFLYFPHFLDSSGFNDQSVIPNGQELKEFDHGNEFNTVVCLDNTVRPINLKIDNIVSEPICERGNLAVEDCKTYPSYQFTCDFLNAKFRFDDEITADVNEGSLSDHLKMEQVSPNIIKISSFMTDGMDTLPADYSERERNDSEKVPFLITYLIFGDKRPSDFHPVPWHTRADLKGEDLLLSGVGREFNQEVIDFIIRKFSHRGNNNFQMTTALEHLEQVKDNELGQRIASCMVADYLFDDLDLNIDESHVTQTNCALGVGDQDCTGVYDIRHFNDKMSYFPEYISGRKKNIPTFKSDDKPVVNLLFAPAVGQEEMSLKHSRLIDSRTIENHKLFDNDDYINGIGVDSLLFGENSFYRRNFVGKSRELHFISNDNKYEFNDPLFTNLILTGESFCSDEKEKASSDTLVYCLPDRIRILVNNFFDETTAVFKIMGYQDVKVKNISFEVIPDPRFVSIISEGLFHLNLDGYSNYFTKILSNNPMFDAYGKVKLQEGTGEYNKEFIQENIFNLTMLKKMVSSLVVNDQSGNSIFKVYPSPYHFFPFEVEASRRYESIETFGAQDWYELYGDYRSKAEYDLGYFNRAFFIQFYSHLTKLKKKLSSNLFDITDNGYVEISNVKLSGVVEDHFILLRGNKFHEVDGVHYQPYDNFNIFSKKYQGHLKENTRESTVLSVDNGGSDIVYDGFVPRDGVIEYGIEKYLNGPLKVNGNEIGPFLADRFSYYRDIRSLDEVTSNADIIDFLKDEDFILPHTVDLEPIASDSNNYDYGEQCYLNANIEDCMNNGECDAFQKCSDTNDCKNEFICHPDLNYCTKDCVDNFPKSEEPICTKLSFVSKCINQFCSPMGCENTYTTITNSTFKGNEYEDLDILNEDKNSTAGNPMLYFKNINGLVYNNRFESAGDSLSSAISIEYNFNDLVMPEGQFNNLRIEKNTFTDVIVEAAGAESATNVLSVGNNIFYNSIIDLVNSNWRSYWEYNLFFIREIKRNHINGNAQIMDRGNFRYGHEDPFFGRNVFQKNIFYNLENYSFYYRPKGSFFPVDYVSFKIPLRRLNFYFGMESKNENDVKINAIYDTNHFVSTEDTPTEILQNNPIAEIKLLWDSLFNLFDPFFYIESAEDILDIFNRNQPCLSNVPIDRDFPFLTDLPINNDMPIDNGSESNRVLFTNLEERTDQIKFRFQKGFLNESYFNYKENDPYSKSYHFRKDFNGKNRRIKTNFGPFEDGGQMIECNFLEE